MVMGALLGIMFLGISWLAAEHARRPERRARPCISQIAKAVFGTGPSATSLFLVVQAATMLILVLAANTSFADFPRLASFHADDALHAQAAHQARPPAGVLQRHHRPGRRAAAVLVVLFQADVTHLIPLYAIGVFTSFTLSQAGMAKRHLRVKEPGWRLGLLVNGTRRGRHRRRDHRDRDHEVHPRRLGDHDPRPGPGVPARAAQPPVRVARRSELEHEARRGGRRARSCAATRCSC